MKIKINAPKIDAWKSDIAKSVDYYNEWFLNFAPEAYRETRSNTASKVLDCLEKTDFLRNINAQILATNPNLLPILRMATRPPIARDRLIGLSGVSSYVVLSMEKNAQVPSKLDLPVLTRELEKVSKILTRMVDTDIFTWLESGNDPSEIEKDRSAIIIADRLCGMIADPIIRNAQEKRQLRKMKEWLESIGYSLAEVGKVRTLDSLKPGTFSFRLNVLVNIGPDSRKVNIPVDIVIKPKDPSKRPILIEAKSAGDFTNTNKRRKEEAVKYSQLKATYGEDIPFLLFLCGYFDSGYLGYEAAEGIDWIWEHRMEDLTLLGL
jgi:hypothetical protein